MKWNVERGSMKKLLGILVLGLLVCNVAASDISKLTSPVERMKKLLKGNYKCQSIKTQGEWTFSFSRKYGGAGINYYIKKNNDKTSNKWFAGLKYKGLAWYYLLPVEGNKVLIANVLNLDPKSPPLNFESIIIFFDTNFTKEYLEILENAANKSELIFFNEAHNFVHTRIKTNNASSESWENFDRAVCKSDQL